MRGLHPAAAWTWARAGLPFFAQPGPEVNAVGVTPFFVRSVTEEGVFVRLLPKLSDL